MSHQVLSLNNAVSVCRDQRHQQPCQGADIAISDDGLGSNVITLEGLMPPALKWTERSCSLNLNGTGPREQVWLRRDGVGLRFGAAGQRAWLHSALRSVMSLSHLWC